MLYNKLGSRGCDYGILNRNQLHYVSDEIYMNSIHDEGAEFISALSIDK